MNSDIIRQLPDSVANQIAAGEVIQRPASVIKELVENSVDAGATDIRIILRDAGRTLVQVVDNGSGMSPADARMAFERHATSKISSADDLTTLTTMGFRGEALPSICSVAQVEMRTMRPGDAIGTRICFSDAHFESQEPAAGVPGTNIMVKNIFFHMPARRKFLKKDSIELNHILREFERLALVNTGVDFTLIHNDVTLHQFGRGTLKQRIVDLFGKSLDGQLAHLAVDTALVRIEGFVAMPRYGRRRGYQQFLFVNGRNMNHPFFKRAVLKCYEQLIPADTQPSFFLNFEVDPSTIDVNIHPQKYEIKFEHEQAIWQILVAAVRETLGKSEGAGTLDFDSAGQIDIPLFNPADAPAMPTDDFDPMPSRTPEAPVRPAADNDYNAPWRPARVSSDWEKLYESFNRRRDSALAETADDLFEGSAPAESTASCFQLQGRYIVSTSQAGLMIIDQHRAHRRILYERFLKQLENGALPTQKLIFPEVFEASPSQNALLTAMPESFAELGFELVSIDKLTWNILGVPAPLVGVNPAEALADVLNDVADEGTPDPQALRAPLADAMSRRAAIAEHQTLSQAEMESVIADLFRCAQPSLTPDGHPVTGIIDNETIEKLFR